LDAKIDEYFIYIEKGPYAPREDLPFVKRENVALVIKYLNSYMFLSWNKVGYQKSLVTGGIDSNETKEAAVERELLEETGYYDIESIIPIPAINISKFFVEHKNQNREATYYPYLVILNSLKQQEISEEEKQEHSLIWVLKDKLDEIDLFENHRYMLNKAIENDIK
jgi:hypothetical protein